MTAQSNLTIESKYQTKYPFNLPASVLTQVAQKEKIELDQRMLTEQVQRVWSTKYPDIPVPVVSRDTKQKFYLEFDNAGKICINGAINPQDFEKSLGAIYHRQLEKVKKLHFYDCKNSDNMIAHGKGGISYELQLASAIEMLGDDLYYIERVHAGVDKDLTLVKDRHGDYSRVPMALARAQRCCQKDYIALTKNQER